jgi:hypothetical protein
MVGGWRSFSSEKLSEAHRPTGTVKLSVDERPNMNDVRKPNLSCKALQNWSARHAFPGLVGLGAVKRSNVVTGLYAWGQGAFAASFCA